MSHTPLCIYFLTHTKNFEYISTSCLKLKKSFEFELFSSAFECAKKTHQFESDLIFIENDFFNNFQSNIKKLYSLDSVFTFKRCVVFSLNEEFSDSRLLELSLFGIRSSFYGVRKFHAHLKNIVEQVKQFQNARPKISLCLSGGGLDGYMYSLGVCSGLEKCLENFQMQDSDIFCGISSGAILACCFAGGVRSSELIQQAYKKHPALESLSLGTLFDFAFSDICKEAYHRRIPTALFKGEKLKEFFVRQINYFGISDDLESIKKDIYIFATDQDTGEIVVFGQEPWKKSIKISEAIRASTALPPFYLPENINGHWFTDGQLASSIELDFPIHEKSSLIFVIDPIVSFSSTQPGEVKSRGGFFTALQAIKKLIHSRSHIALKHARDQHPDVDFIKLQPTNEIMESMSGNPMRVPIQTKLIQMSAIATCEQIVSQYDFYKHIFAKHGLTLKPQSEIQI